jgi:hypothetical protein
MRRRACTLFFLLMAAVALVSAVPQSDLPETSYNEADTPVNLAAPAVSAPTFVRPLVTVVILPQRLSEVGSGLSHEPLHQKWPVPLFQRDAHSLQELLCTFLI